MSPTTNYATKLHPDLGVEHNSKLVVQHGTPVSDEDLDFIQSFANQQRLSQKMNEEMAKFMDAIGDWWKSMQRVTDSYLTDPAMLEAVTSEIATWLRCDNNTKEDASNIHRWTKHRLVFAILYYYTLAVLLLEETDCFFNGKSFDMANVDHCEQEAWVLLGYACDLLRSAFEPKSPAVQFVGIRGDDEANEAFWEEIEENATDVKARAGLAWCLAMMDKTDDALPVIKTFLDNMVPKGRRKADVLDKQRSRF